MKTDDNHSTSGFVLDENKVISFLNDLSYQNGEFLTWFKCPICGELGNLVFTKKKKYGSHYCIIYHKTDRRGYANGKRYCKISWYDENFSEYYERFRQIHNQFRPNKVEKIPAVEVQQ